jgi:hypothetical protein
MKCYPSNLIFSFLALALSCGTAQSKTIVVRSSIADALAEATDGDSVLIEGPRTFNAQLVVTNAKRVDLRVLQDRFPRAAPRDR